MLGTGGISALIGLFANTGASSYYLDEYGFDALERLDNTYYDVMIYSSVLDVFGVAVGILTVPVWGIQSWLGYETPKPMISMGVVSLSAIGLKRIVDVFNFVLWEDAQPDTD